jgi:iron complex outermembrane recepter protein
VGLWAYLRDNRAAGGFTGSRSARAHSIAGFAYEELAAGGWRLQGGARYDWTRVVPHDLTPIRLDGREVPVRARTFGAVSGSVAALREVHPGWTLGVSLARAFRTPTVEELFSDGPHLGDFSYDVGNPDLAAETGVGAEVLLRAALPRVRVEASVFRNAIRGYVHHRPTGETDPRFFRFPVFEARGEDARFVGAEGSVQWEPVRHVVVDGSAAWVRASLAGSGDPLPAIPPLNGRLGVRYDPGRWFATAAWQGAGAQNRVAPALPDPVGAGPPLVPERRTPGYGLLHAGAGLRWMRGARFHTLTLSADNLTDAEWRDHLSRIKDVAPQPGLNLQVLYRVAF